MPGVVVAVQSPKTRFMLIDALDALGIRFTMCELGDAICEIASVILSDHLESGTLSSRIILVRDDTDIEGALIATLVNLQGIDAPFSASLGIDPGLRFGIALVINGLLINTCNASSPGEAADVTMRWSSILRERFGCDPIIRVGDGLRLFTILFLRALQHRSNMARIELVDEHHTTLTSGANNDRSSAALIAQRQGHPADDLPLTIEAKEGHIRLMKRLFGRLTGGSSLSTEEATLLLAGDVTLDEIVGHHSSKNE